MKRFLGFVKKEFYHIVRDYRTMLIIFGIPVAQLLIFGVVITNEIKDAKIAILDHSKDDISRDITNKLLSSGYFILGQELETTKEIENIFQKGEVNEVLIFEANFADKIEQEGHASIQVIADASDPNMANLLVNYTSGIIRDYEEKVLSKQAIPMQIIPEVRMMYNQGLKGVFMFVPGTMALILMLISAMMTSISIAREKEYGSMEILLASPLRPVQIILGKVMPYVLISFINAVVIFLLGYFVFGLPVRGSTVLLLSESLLFIVLALSLGIFISTISKTQEVAMFISIFALMLPTILLSGFIFPIESMPKILQWISVAMPPRWFIVIIKNIMLKGTGFWFVWKETLILVGITLFFILLSLKKFKVRLE